MIMSKIRLFVLVFLIIPVFCADVGWLSDWNYRKRIEVTNQIPEDLEDYQIAIILDTETLIGDGKMRGDCGDVRFADNDGSTQIDYWLESGCNESSTRFWVEIPTLLSEETKDIYAYYGAPGKISSSSGDNVFKFFDHFDENSIGSKWQIYDGSSLRNSGTGYAYVNVINSSAVLNSVSNYNFVTKSYKTKRPVIVEMKGWLQEEPSSNNGKTLTIMYYDPEVNFNPERVSYQAFTNSSGTCILNASASQSQEHHPSSTYSISNSTWYIQRMILTDDNVTSELLDDSYSELNSISIENSEWDSKKLGIDHYNDGTAGELLYVDWFVVREYANTTPGTSVKSEEEKPPLTYAFQGSEASNMRTIIFTAVSEENPVKIELEPLSPCDNVEDNSTESGFGTFYYNLSGYSVNGTFRRVNATNVTYFENCQRVSVEYYNTIGNMQIWHIVQAFESYPLIKHVVFVHTSGSETEYNETLWLDSSCTSFLNSSGSHSCSSNMHSSSGYFESSDASYCNMHWGSDGFNLTETVKIHAGYGKEVFWEALNKDCDPYLKEIELFCGRDFPNCTVSPSSPVRIPFYNGDSSLKQLGRINVSSDFTATVNGKSTTGALIDTRFVGLEANYVEVSGSGNISRVDVVLSRPYTSTLFFGEKPGIYRLTVKGPLDGAAAEVDGIPVTDKILPFQNLNGKTHMDLGIGSSIVDIDIFKTRTGWSFKNSGLYHLTGTLKKLSATQLPIAGSRDLQPPMLPPTHDIYSVSRMFYSNNIIAEVVMTAWRAV